MEMQVAAAAREVVDAEGVEVDATPAAGKVAEAAEGGDGGDISFREGGGGRRGGGAGDSSCKEGGGPGQQKTEMQVTAAARKVAEAAEDGDGGDTNSRGSEAVEAGEGGVGGDTRCREGSDAERVKVDATPAARKAAEAEK